MMLRLAIAAGIACCARPVGAGQFPYATFVTASDAYLRSGPGDAYYPVTKLRHGQQVEVHRHDPGGWCAVRPPSDSFSWVSAEFVEPRQGNVGVVVGNRVAIRVGSDFSNTRDVIQVRLNAGDEVEILEAQDFDDGGVAKTWYKIAPPAGEFRWILARQLERQFDEPDSDDEKRGWVRPAAHEDDEPSLGGKRRSLTPPRKLDDEDGATDDRDDGGKKSEDEHIERLRSDNRRPKEDLQQEAEDLDLALSAMVTADTPQWKLEILRREGEEAIVRAQTALERGRIRRVLRKIDNFADIQRRYLTVMDTPASTNRSHPATLAVHPPLRYDGVGRLTLLSSLDPRLPQYALVDATGRMVTYVAPAPGVNLRRYLNQDVGINGNLGYLPERQSQLLTAKRIVPITR